MRILWSRMTVLWHWRGGVWAKFRDVRIILYHILQIMNSRTGATSHPRGLGPSFKVVVTWKTFPGRQVPAAGLYGAQLMLIHHHIIHRPSFGRTIYSVYSFHYLWTMFFLELLKSQLRWKIIMIWSRRPAVLLLCAVRLDNNLFEPPPLLMQRGITKTRGLVRRHWSERPLSSSRLAPPVPPRAKNMNEVPFQIIRLSRVVEQKLDDVDISPASRERADVTNRTHNFKGSRWIFATTKTGKLILGGVLRGRDYQPKTFPDKTTREVVLSGPGQRKRPSGWINRFFHLGAELEAIVRLSWTLCNYVVLGEIWHFMSLLHFLYWWVLPGPCLS